MAWCWWVQDFVVKGERQREKEEEKNNKKSLKCATVNFHK
jgi:hypothetical protein